MVVFSACLDASLSDPAKLTVVGGYIGADAEWELVEREWQENLAYWGLSDFHIADLPATIGHEKAVLCSASFARIIGHSGLWAINAATINRDYSYFWDERSRAGYKTVYHFTLERALELISEFMKSFYPNEKVSLFIDRDSIDDVATNSLFDYWKNVRNPNGGFISLTISDRRTHIGIQCADLGAWVHRKVVNKEDMNECLAATIRYTHSFGEQGMSSLWSLESMWKCGDVGLRQMRIRLDNPRLRNAPRLELE